MMTDTCCRIKEQEIDALRDRIAELEDALREARAMLGGVSLADDFECGDIRDSWNRGLTKIDAALGKSCD